VELERDMMCKIDIGSIPSLSRCAYISERERGNEVKQLLELQILEARSAVYGIEGTTK